jgi:hypothetical protein
MVGATCRMPAANPLNVTETPAICIDNGTVSADAALDASWFPKIDTIEPGAIGWVLSWVTELTIPEL